MTEYVCRIDESRTDSMGNMPCEQREEIVRCRDCVHSWKEGASCRVFNAFDEPDGFCAWGRRRES